MDRRVESTLRVYIQGVCSLLSSYLASSISPNIFLAIHSSVASCFVCVCEDVVFNVYVPTHELLCCLRISDDDKDCLLHIHSPAEIA